FYADSDNQFDLNDFGKFLQYIGHYDIIAGRRIKRNDPLSRIITSRIYNFIGNLVFGTVEHDKDCAFRLVSKDVIDGIELKCRTGLGTTELLAKARVCGFKTKVVGISHYQRKFGTPIFEGRFLNMPKISVVRDVVREMKILRDDLRILKNNPKINKR
ncbi:hypothetical protein HYX09_05715, partial [Candidatus Woesearchaeota archaeon]|nr:hypothetical protein [Candidatus Woesearchaeota archaeon]